MSTIWRVSLFRGYATHFIKAHSFSTTVRLLSLVSMRRVKGGVADKLFKTANLEKNRKDLYNRLEKNSPDFRLFS